MKPESIDQRTKARPVATLAHDYPKGMLIEWHAHDRGQLIYARSGIMTVMTAEGSWVVPPHRAVWVPATTDHAIQCGTRLSMRTLYVAHGAAPRLPQTCAVVQVSPLLRELIVALVEAPGSSRRRAHLTVLILDEIRATPVAPLHLPEPRDARLRRLTAALAADPGDRTDLGAWGREVGASSRTLTRLFLRETGMTFRQWQRQARLLAALVKLAEGEPVTRVADPGGPDADHRSRRVTGAGAPPSRRCAVEGPAREPRVRRPFHTRGPRLCRARPSSGILVAPATGRPARVAYACSAVAAGS